ncbi:MAG: response regulator transcription factor [Pedobacter sp.]|nr:MAG: response regulator transcription factor [Pedobacter sp.]
MTTAPKINIAIADDHTIMRNGLAELIKTLGNYEIIIQAGNGVELLSQLARASTLPELCILDINMPELNGYETTLKLKETYPDIKVMALSMFDNEFSIVRMLRNGATGFLHKGANPDELSDAIQTVLSGNYFHTELALIHSLKKNNNWQTVNITERETEFLQHCCSDLSYKEIASKMGVSLHTVHGYRDMLFQKLRLKSRTALAIYALKTGVVTD